MWLTCTCCGAQKKVETRCKKRWCPVCARQISAQRVGKYAGAVNAMQWPLFVTLTRPNLANLCLKDIKAMRSGYRRLRQQAWWKRCVLGGIASVEITNTGKGWHPHIHSILDARWLAVTTPPPKPFETRKVMQAKFKAAGKEVAARWAAALDLPKASIHVKRAYTERTTPEMPGSNQSIAVEVLKYSVKPSDLIKCEEPIGDLLRLMGAARLVSSFGSCYGKNLLEDEEEYHPEPCECGAIKTWMPDSVVDMIAGRPRVYA